MDGWLSKRNPELHFSRLNQLYQGLVALYGDPDTEMPDILTLINAKDKLMPCSAEEFLEALKKFVIYTRKAK